MRETGFSDLEGMAPQSVWIMPTESNQLQRTILQGVWPWFGLLEGGKGVVLRTPAQSLHSALAPQIPRSLDANTPDEVTAFEKSLLH